MRERDSQRKLVDRLKRDPSTLKYITPEVERAMLDPEPAVRIHAGLPVLEAVARDPNTTADMRKALEEVIEALRSELRALEH